MLAEIERRLIEVNRYLAQGSFQPMFELFQFPFPWVEPVNPVDRAGKRIAYTASTNPPALIIRAKDTDQVELEMAMPVIPSIQGSDNPENDCGAQGFPHQGWYDHESRTVVLQLVFSSARDGCEQPEQWLLKRL